MASLPSTFVFLEELNTVESYGVFSTKNRFSLLFTTILEHQERVDNESYSKPLNKTLVNRIKDKQQQIDHDEKDALLGF